MASLTREEFLADPQGRRFADVVDRDRRVDFQGWLDFFNDASRQQRMQDAESAYGRPALAGVVKELEEHPVFKDFLSKNDAHTTLRGRQAIGVLVSIIMQKLGWRKTGIKGSLGTRAPAEPNTTTPGAYHNTSGISKWFTKAERYESLSQSEEPEKLGESLTSGPDVTSSEHYRRSKMAHGHGANNVPFEQLSYAKKRQSINATINLYLPQAIDNLLASSPDPEADRKWVLELLRGLVSRVEAE